MPPQRSPRSHRREPKSKAIDQAAAFYVKMAGGTTAVPTSALAKLLATAEAQGSLTATEIAAILDTDELEVTAEIEWSVGGDLQ